MATKNKTKKTTPKTVVRLNGMRLDTETYNKVMQIGEANNRSLVYLTNLALEELAEKYKGKKV